jgi:pinin/SDK/memA/ protein conserved region
MISLSLQHAGLLNILSLQKRPRLDMSQDGQRRGKRMFGVLMGTLSKFKTETSNKTTAVRIAFISQQLSIGYTDLLRIFRRSTEKRLKTS